VGSLTLGPDEKGLRLSSRALSDLGALALLALLFVPSASACTGSCASHAFWPTVHGRFRSAHGGSARFVGSRRSDELLGHHGSDVLSGRGRSDILWGDRDPAGQPTSQHDVIYGGSGDDFIYGSHGYNAIYGGTGNDAISVHYGRGIVDCGPGRDIYHVARKRRHAYRFVNCEKVDYRSERHRGGGLRPLP
jgi:RTX calcium-binding nonapeptide repeat (4 copies)